MRAFIYEGNLERLQKHVNRIAKKAVRYGNEAVSMMLTGAEEFRECYTGRDNVLTGKKIYETRRFIEVEVTGEAHCDGWRFIATVEHVSDGMNVIRRYDTSDGIRIPEKYRSTPPVCEHCGTNRRRKDTYLVYHETDDTWMQVGKTCLHDLTGGLSAEAIADWISLWDDVVKCEAPGEAGGERYYDVDEILRIACAVTRVRGFVPTRDDDGGYNDNSTREICLLHWTSERYGLSMEYQRDIVRWDMEHGYVEKDEDVETVRAWIASLEGDRDYVLNLKALCSRAYCTHRDVGLLVSAPHSMVRDAERAEQRRAEAARRRAEATGGQWVGTVGERIRVKVDHVRVLTSYETMYGWTYINGIWDEDGNAYIWKTSRVLGEDTKELVGTVKAHGEYRGAKQTELTRCKQSA